MKRLLVLSVLAAVVILLPIAATSGPYHTEEGSTKIEKEGSPPPAATGYEAFMQALTESAERVRASVESYLHTVVTVAKAISTAAKAALLAVINLIARLAVTLAVAIGHLLFGWLFG